MRIAVLCGFLLFSGTVSAELPSIPARLKPGGAPKVESSVIDRFIGYWKDAKSRRLYGTLEVWDILTAAKGDPLRPTKKGAVLTGLNTVSYATLAPNVSTRPTRLTGVQHVMYIASGWGKIASGDIKAEVRQGFGVIIPPGVEFTLSNGGEKPLTLYLIEEIIPRGFTPRSRLTVKNDFDQPVNTNRNRSDARGWLFSPRDGLASLTGMDPIVFLPRSYVVPHVHLPGDEEIWIALDEINVQIGRERRLLPEGSAYRAPADSKTPHVNINSTNTDKRLLWIMRVPGSSQRETPSGRGMDKDGII